MSYSVMLVGLGQIGMGYDLTIDSKAIVYTHARAIKQHSNFNLIAAVDEDSVRCKEFEDLYDCVTYNNISLALSEHSPDLVIIAVPTIAHYEVLVTILNLSKPLVILCEKPLSYSLEESRSMVAACHEKGVKLYVNYMRRSDPGVIEIKNRLDTNEILSPVKGVAWYTKGFLHNGSHFFNLMEYWLGSMLDAKVLSSDSKDAEVDIEPDVYVSFEKGDIVFFSGWEKTFSHSSIEFVGENGRLCYENGGETIGWQTTRQDSNIESYNVLVSSPENICTGMDRYQWHVVDQISTALCGDEYYLCSGDDALQTLESMHMIIGKSL